MLHNREILQMSLTGYREEINTIQIKMREIEDQLGIDAAARKPVLVETTAAQPSKPRRHRSAATRAKMRKAQRARWAKIRAESKSKSRKAA